MVRTFAPEKLGYLLQMHDARRLKCTSVVQVNIAPCFVLRIPEYPGIQQSAHQVRTLADYLSGLLRAYQPLEYEYTGLTFPCPYHQNNFRILHKCSLF